MRFVSIIIPYAQKKASGGTKFCPPFSRKETQAQAEGTIHMPAIYEGMNAAAVTLVSLSIILFAGFLVTRVTKLLRLPNVSGFIIAGLLIGPGALGLIPQSTVDGMSFGQRHCADLHRLQRRQLLQARGHPLDRTADFDCHAL